MVLQMNIACVGYLLVMLSVTWIKFLHRMDDIVSSCNFRSFVTDMFLNDIITDDIIVLMFTWLSFSLSFMLLPLGEVKMNKTIIARLTKSHR